MLDTGQEGVTFDELVETFNASKSSVSNSLHYLSQLKYIDHNSKIDSRKRYYKLSPGSLILRLQQIFEMLESEKLLSIKLKKYKLSQIKDPYDAHIQRSEIYVEHLDNATKQLSKTITKLKLIK